MDKKLLSVAAGVCAAAVLAGGLAVWAADGGQEEVRPVNPNPSYFETVKQDIQGTAQSEALAETDRLVCENNRLALYLDEDDFIVKVVDKQGDYVWSSGAADNEAQSMTGTWKRFSRAFLTMDYYNGTGASLRSSARFSKETADLAYTATGLAATLRFQEPDATVRVYIDITENGFTVRIPDEEMVFNKPENRLAKLYVLPFLGSSYADSIPGYFFIPDGSGALMRFDKPKTYNSSTLLRMYGRDYSVSPPASYQSGLAPTGVKNLNFPLYGAVHGSNQNAFVGVITGGEVYSGFEISPAGVKIDFHWMSPVFIYREQYRQATSSSVGYDVIQKVPNEVNPEITYTLLSGEEANYVGMANAYRRQLDEKGALPQPVEAGENIPVFLQALMADRAKSLFGHTTKVFTTLEDVTGWTSQLGEKGLDNLMISLYGFEKGGYSGGKAGGYKPEGRVGSAKELKALSQLLESNGSTLLLSKELARAYEGQAKKYNFLYAINRVFTTSYDTGFLYNSRYYLDMPTMSKLFEQAAGLPEYQRNLALPAVGNTLHSNYKEDRETTRVDALRTVREGLALLKEAGGTVALEAPSAYALQWADALYNVDMTHSRYIFETDAVPFLQIVVSGRAPVFAPYLNLNAGGESAVLQLIDYNVYPAYMLTESASDEMTQCNINYVYSSRFEDYLPELVQVYNQVNPILSQVAGAGITGRTCPQDGISVVRYDNGRTIIVNYTSGEVAVEGTIVPAQQAVCI